MEYELAWVRAIELDGMAKSRSRNAERQRFELTPRPHSVRLPRLRLCGPERAPRFLCCGLTHLLHRVRSPARDLFCPG